MVLGRHKVCLEDAFACFVKKLFGTGTNYCNGEGCSCVLHEVVKAFVPVEIIMSWLVAKIHFKVFLIY